VPAPAVIPAPIAYIKVVAVKKLVVEIRHGWLVRLTACTGPGRAYLLGCPRVLDCALGTGQDFYFEKIRVFKAGICSDTLAWNNEIGRRSYFVGF
jgi:hypothetical protein